VPGDESATVSAAIIDEVPFTQLIPITFDEKLAASRAPGAAALGVMHVPRVDIVQSFGDGYLPRAIQSLLGRTRFVEHFKIGMEGGEVPGHIGPEVFREPIGGAMNLPVAVILIRDEQGGDFEPDFGFLQEFQGLEHWCEAGEAKSMVKIFGESFEIHVRGVHVLVEFGASFGSDVTSGDGDRLDAGLPAGFGDLDRVFCEDDRVIVGKCDRSAAMPPSFTGDVFGGGGVGQLVPFARLADVPVLTKAAAEIATGCSEGEHAGSGQEVVERFLLDGIDTEPAAAAIGGQDNPIVQTLSNKTEPSLAFVNLAKARTEPALQTPIRKGVPPSTGIVGFSHRRSHMFLGNSLVLTETI
jgi:hypothetical protein